MDEWRLQFGFYCDIFFINVECSKLFAKEIREHFGFENVLCLYEISSVFSTFSTFQNNMFEY